MKTAAFTLVLFAALVAVITASHPRTELIPYAPAEADGDASSGLLNAPPNHAVQVAFAKRSYTPGQVAILHLRGAAGGLHLQIFRAGAGHDGPLQGSPVVGSHTVAGSADRLAVPLGPWASGLYYAKVTTPGKGVWYAPFVLRPKHLGAHRVLVVLPTNTWQAYNYEDKDSWYFDPSVHTVDLTRPYIDGGVPPHYTGYDRGFIRWLTLQHKQVDFVSDDELDDLASGQELARDYDLIVFSGHEEYVTDNEFNVIDDYRNRGGNLAFLSANDFFYRVDKVGDEMNGRWRWRDLGRPEASLVGAQYVNWDQGKYPNKPFTVTGTTQASWLFRGTGLHDGTTFGHYGIEVDALAATSPPDTKVLARIPDIFGPGESAEMTYYTTSKGAKVFSAGVMNFGGSSLWPVVSTMMENIWGQLTRP